MLGERAIRGGSEDIVDQAVTYRLDTVYLGTGHYQAAELAERRHRALGVAATALSAVVGTSIFATVTEEPPVIAHILAGIASVVATVLMALQTFLRYDERAEKHRLAGAAYARLRRELDAFLLETATDPDRETSLAKLAALRRRLSEIAEGRPLIPTRAYKRGRNQIAEEAGREATSIGRIAAYTISRRQTDSGEPAGESGAPPG